MKSRQSLPFNFGKHCLLNTSRLYFHLIFMKSHHKYYIKIYSASQNKIEINWMCPLCVHLPFYFRKLCILIPNCLHLTFYHLHLK